MNKALFLGDCIVNHAEKEFKGQLDSVFMQIQGGGSFNPESFNFNEYDNFFLLNSWANAASVIEDEAVWSDRINHQIKILTAIAETKMPFLIIELDKDYSYTVIGYPSKKYVWIMARDPRMEEKRYNLILENLSEIGYDISLIQKVPQIWSK